jgi:NTE family protein
MIVSEEPRTVPRTTKGHKRTQFETIALLLQGGGALGAYQAGVYQALAEADLHPDWVSGISIGSINAAIIAGNPPNDRVNRLREFWETVSKSPLESYYLKPMTPSNNFSHAAVSAMEAMKIVLFGANGFFAPRFPFGPAQWLDARSDELSYYDTSPLRATLKRLVDLDRINSGTTRVSVGAVNVCTGDLRWFDTTTDLISVDHFLAIGSLPFGFPATQIDGQLYWDGGVVFNTPLRLALEDRPRRDMLAFQVDVWSARGARPRNLIEVGTRVKEIWCASRTRIMTDRLTKEQKLRAALHHVVKQLPKDLRDTDDIKAIEMEADDKVINLVHLTYRAKNYEALVKEFEFSRATMRAHWNTGYRDAQVTLTNPEIFKLPDRKQGFRIFDMAE